MWWFDGNYKTPNAGKCHFMFLGKNAVNENFYYKKVVGVTKTTNWSVKVTLRNYVKKPHRK